MRRLPLGVFNLPTAGVDYPIPFGGRKGSRYGPREQGRYAAEFFYRGEDGVCAGLIERLSVQGRVSIARLSRHHDS